MTERSSRRGRPTGPGLDGILVVAKPPGPTSHDVVALVRRLAATKRVGHGGTLDPFASGVLPVFLGRATRVVEYHLGDRKEYRATVCFGATSTTDDLEGTLEPVAGPPVTPEAVEAALPAFRGRITQTPPVYSAVKIGGRRAYALARAGQAVELSPREVEIERIAVVEWDGSDPDRPVAIVDVVCSAGTYIRALARDLGVAVGSGAYLGGLTRTASGPFRLVGAVALGDVRSAAAEGPDRLAALLRPIDAGLEDLPAIVLPESDVPAIARGQIVRAPAGVRELGADRPIRMFDRDGSLVGFATVRDGRLAPDKVLIAPPPQGPEAEPEPATAGDD
ncbi:MAG TPA: tRNA pseudouridine(55) synthase TruB [Candidatus Limnocylindrales bacterium]|nr:tRNA pseudouridine(55) synthase TruB [Candidatus Limnocylindrales bacterium]